jgi:ribosomal protein S18 acetylase RimI-like enzyme
MLFANPAVFMKILIQHHMIQWRFIRYMMAKFFHENLGGKWSTTMTGLKNAGELRSVVVQPEYRGLSVGNALLKASVGFTGQNNWGTLIAWVAESNLPSRRLFESAGFSKIAEKMEAHGKVYLYEGCSKGK